MIGYIEKKIQEDDLRFLSHCCGKDSRTVIDLNLLTIRRLSTW